MWTLLRLAVRNIRRNRARTALTLGAIGFGVLMAILLGGVAQGLTNTLRDDAILSKVSAIQIHKKGYADLQDSSPLDLDFEQGGELEAKIRAIPGVTDVTPRIVFQGLINAPGASSMIVINAVDPVHEYNVLPRATKDIAGKAITAQDANGIVVGMDLADALGIVEWLPAKEPGGTLTPSLKEGATAILSAAKKGGQQNAIDVDIVGGIAAADPFSNKRLTYVPLAFAQELLDMKGRVNEYYVGVADRERSEVIRDQIAAAIGSGYEVQSWKEARPDVADRIFFLRTALAFVFLVFLVIVVIGVVNTMLMSVLERTREIGTMMAVGVRRLQITILFLLEGLTLAVLGGAGGATVGLSLVGLMAARGGFAVAPPGSKSRVVWQIIPNAPPSFVAVAIGAAMLGTLCAAAYPAWRASRLRPVEALRAV